MDIINKHTRIINYPLDLNQFNVLANPLSKKLSYESNSWYRISASKFSSALVAALKDYILLNNHKIRIESELFDPCYYSALKYINHFLVPR